MTLSDLDLLRDYVRGHSQEAFTTLVHRHLNMVHSAALRQVRSPQLAEEVAQSVFTDLARDAAKLVQTGFQPSGSPTPWLYAVTRRTAIDVIRKESRRQLREQIATEMNAMNATTADWTQIGPLLDDAMSALDETDRAAVLLRYFENKSLREVGATLGTSDDAAQKRVSRAVERLREFFAKRGITVGVSGLVVVISANAVQAAPIGLAVTISTSAIAATLTTATIVTTATMNWINAKAIAAIVTAALAAGTGTYLVQKSEADRARNDTQNLITEKERLTTERDEALSAAKLNSDEIERLGKNQSELLRLRSEVGQIRRQLETQKSEVRVQPAAVRENPKEIVQGTSTVLLGTWSGEETGRSADGKASLVIDGSMLEFRGANPMEWYTATFSLREDTTPKQLIAVITACPAPEYIGKTVYSIYEVTDDGFIITGNEPGNPEVPASFDAPRARKIVFKRN